MRARRSQPGKEIIFIRFLEKVFGISPETITMEVPVVSNILLVRGRIDAVFGNIIMEFKVSLERELEDAKTELAKYFQSFAEKYPSRSYIGIAHDGLDFRVFQPVHETQLDTGKTVITFVKEIDHLNLESEQDPERIYLWFDSYFFASDRVYPSSQDITRRLGTESPTYHAIEKKFEEYFDKSMKFKRNRLKYDNWAKALEFVYGERVEGRDLFIKHTYLATLAKLLIHLIVTKAKVVYRQDIRGIMYGDVFKTYGITNFIEEDFYTWILDKEIRQEALDVLYSLMRELLVYNLDDVNEDFLKSLYEELVNPEVRHGLGEYYTPDWLAEMMVDSLLSTNPEGSVLDPACGSGTFLFASIRWKITSLQKRGFSPLEILTRIINNVKGADIHPLAVIIARANYLLAIRGLLGASGRGSVRIPVFLCDTLLLPKAEWEYESYASVYKIPATGNAFFLLPEVSPNNPEVLDLFIEQIAKFAKQYEKNIELGSVAEARKQRPQVERLFSDQVEQLFTFPSKSLPLKNLKTMLDLIERDENSIWAFILKNIHKPLTLANEKFDFVIGNPPWIAYHSTNATYQEFLKPQITKVYRLLVGRAELITHLEIATYFLLRATDLYLQQGGRIGFVLPRSVFNVGQHDGLRQGTYSLSQDKSTNLVLKSVWDCEKVQPLFTIPPCVVFGQKLANTTTTYPLDSLTISGNLPTKNIALKLATEFLAKEEGKLFLETHGKRSFWTTQEGKSGDASSYYRSKFIQGAVMVPRTFWFVKIKSSSLGFDTDFPPVESRESGKGGPVQTYKEIKFEGNIERQFLFCSIVGDDVIPFGLRSVKLAVLPALPVDRGYQLVDAATAQQKGFTGLSSWLNTAETTWKAKRGAKADRVSIYGWLDYERKLSNQNPQALYRVVYPNFQRVAFAAIIDTQEALAMIKEQTGLTVNNLAIDHALYRFETDDKPEANYVAAVLNSPEIDRRLGEFRRRSQKTHPNVHKKVFDVASIPRYDPNNPLHARLSILGRECQDQVTRWLHANEPWRMESLAKLRSRIRELLKPQLEEIDKLTVELLQ